MVVFFSFQQSYYFEMPFQIHTTSVLLYNTYMDYDLNYILIYSFHL